MVNLLTIIHNFIFSWFDAKQRDRGSKYSRNIRKLQYFIPGLRTYIFYTLYDLKVRCCFVMVFGVEAVVNI